MFFGQEPVKFVTVKVPSYYPDDLLELGEKPEEHYITTKTHINAGEEIWYHHTYGEEGGELPISVMDKDGNILTAGGSFTVHREGIRD